MAKKLNKKERSQAIALIQELVSHKSAQWDLESGVERLIGGEISDLNEQIEAYAVATSELDAERAEEFLDELLEEVKQDESA